MRIAVVWGVLAMLPIISATAAPAPRVEHKAAISITGDGPYYRLDLPTTIYMTSPYVDLSDVRVRNGAGSLVPHAWLLGPESEVRVDSAPVPFFAVPERGRAQQDLTLVFKRGKDGMLTVIKPRRAAPEVEPPAPTEWIVDVSGRPGRLLQLRLAIDAHAEGLFPLHVEASEDLRHWHTVNDDAQLAVLRRGPERIEHLDVALHESAARFLRLRWQDAAQAPSLTEVTVDTVLREERTPPLQWSQPITATCGERHCDYVLPAKMPLDSLRVQLTEPNTVARIALFGVLPTGVLRQMPHRHNPLHVLRQLRHGEALRAVSEAQGVQWIASEIVYRLAQAGSEVRSPDIALDGRVYERLRIGTDGPVAQLGTPPPAVSVGVTPRSLVFLGQGGPPFSLHWGVDEPHGRAAPLSLIAPRHRPGHSEFSAARVDIVAPLPEEPSVTQAAAKEPPAPPVGQRKIWLWAALIAALLVLGAMAAVLFRGMEK